MCFTTQVHSINLSSAHTQVLSKHLSSVQFQEYDCVCDSSNILGQMDNTLELIHSIFIDSGIDNYFLCALRREWGFRYYLWATYCVHKQRKSSCLVYVGMYVILYVPTMQQVGAVGVGTDQHLYSTRMEIAWPKAGECGVALDDISRKKN